MKQTTKHGYTIYPANDWRKNPYMFCRDDENALGVFPWEAKKNCKNLKKKFADSKIVCIFATETKTNNTTKSQTK